MALSYGGGVARSKSYQLAGLATSFNPRTLPTFHYYVYYNGRCPLTASRLLHEKSQNELVLALDVRQLTLKVEWLEAEKAALAEDVVVRRAIRKRRGKSNIWGWGKRDWYKYLLGLGGRGLLVNLRRPNVITKSGQAAIVH